MYFLFTLNNLSHYSVHKYIKTIIKTTVIKK